MIIHGDGNEPITHARSGAGSHLHACAADFDLVTGLEPRTLRDLCTDAIEDMSCLLATQADDDQLWMNEAEWEPDRVSIGW